MTTNQHSWFIQPHYNVLYEDGKVTVLSFSKAKKGREIKQNTWKGYIGFGINNKNLRAHSIVAEHFLGIRPTGLTVNHKDGNKLNNRIENLEYLSIRDNVLHAIRTGLHVCCDPKKMPCYKDGRSRDRQAYNKAYTVANKNKLLAKYKARYLANGESIRAYRRANYLAKKNKTTTTVTTNE